MTVTSQVLLALANPERAQLVRLLATASAPLPVAALSKLLGKTPRDVRRLLRGLERAGVIDDCGGAVLRTSALDAALYPLWMRWMQSCCKESLFTSKA